MTEAEAVALVHVLAADLEVRPPHVTRGKPQALSKERARYHADSRTIVVHEDASVDSVLHEFRHYLDDLLGIELRGATRGTHDAAFYRRLDGLRERFADLLARRRGSTSSP